MCDYVRNVRDYTGGITNSRIPLNGRSKRSTPCRDHLIYADKYRYMLKYIVLISFMLSKSVLCTHSFSQSCVV